MKTKTRNTTALAGLICFSMILLSCGGSASIGKLSASELFSRAQDKLERKKYFSSIELFHTIIYSHPGSSVVDSAQYYLGMSYFGNKDFTLAGIEFNRLLLNYPSSDFADDAQFMKAVSFYEGTSDDFALDQTALLQAISQFEDIIIDHPESDMVEKARDFISRSRNRLAKKTYESAIVYSRMGAPMSAKIYYQRVIDEYTDTEFAALASYGIAESEMKMKNFDEARRQFSNFTVVFADHEFSSKALEKEELAAFKSGENAYEHGEFDLACEKLTFFLKHYPRSERLKKAKEYQNKIDSCPASLSQVKQDES